MPSTVSTDELPVTLNDSNDSERPLGSAAVSEVPVAIVADPRPEARSNGRPPHTRDGSALLRRIVCHCRPDHGPAQPQCSLDETETLATGPPSGVEDTRRAFEPVYPDRRRGGHLATAWPTATAVDEPRGKKRDFICHRLPFMRDVGYIACDI